MPDQPNELLAAALAYAELGYRVFPCVPNQKQPLISDWENNASSDEFQIELWWADNPTANIGIPCTGLLVVDRDADKETGTRNPWLSDDERGMDLFAGPVQQTPRGGDHCWFRQPVGRHYRNTTGRLAPGVDTRADGGFVCVAPSVIDGKHYKWIDNQELCKPELLPVAPQWLIEMLDDRKPVVASNTAPEKIAEGGRNAELTRYAGYLRRGGSTQDEIRAALGARNLRCVPPLPETEVDQIAASVSRYEVDQIQTLIIEGSEPAPASDDPGPFPAKLLEVPGLVREIMDFNLRGAIRPQPELALAAALALCGAIMGRKIEGQTKLRTNIYCLGLCDTGGGKDRSLQVSKKLLMDADMRSLLPCEDLASSAALVNAVKINPVALLQIDEIGKFLQSTKNPEINPHLYDVVTTLLKFFSGANTLYFGKRYADSKRDTSINQPHVCLYGTSVRQSVLDSLTTENLTDGFVSRLLIFEATNNNPERQRDADHGDPPAELVAQIKWWGGYTPGGNLSPLNPQPRMITDGPRVNDLFWDAEDYYRQHRRTGEPGAALWTRATEHARKLALIYQCSMDRESTELSYEAAAWALETVFHLTHAMIYRASDSISDNRVGSDKNKIVRRIKDRGPQSLSQLIRYMQHLRSKELQDLLGDLIAAGIVTTMQSDSKTKKGTVYALARGE